MRKRSFFAGFVFVVFIGLFLTGCAINNYVFDRSIPEENLSIIKIPNELTVVNFDGKNVKTTTAKGIEVKYDFQPGITYKLSSHMVGYNKIAVIVEEYKE